MKKKNSIFLLLLFTIAFSATAQQVLSGAKDAIAAAAAAAKELGIKRAIPLALADFGQPLKKLEIYHFHCTGTTAFTPTLMMTTDL